MGLPFLRLPAWFVPLKKIYTYGELCYCARRTGKEAMFLLYHFFLLYTPLILHLMVSLSNQGAAYTVGQELSLIGKQEMVTFKD